MPDDHCRLGSRRHEGVHRMDITTLRPAQGLMAKYRASGVWRSEGPIADLWRWRDETPEATAVIAHHAEGKTVLTYRQLAEKVEQFAEALAELGVTPGQVVLVQLPNLWQVGALLLACARLGAVVAPVMMTLGPRELERVLDRLEVGVCVTTGEWAGVRHGEAVAEMAPRLPKLRHRVVLDPQGAPAGAVDFTGHFERPDRAGLVPDAPAEDPDRVAMVLFTSGTSGEPKGVLHTANTLYAGTSALVAAEEFGPADRWFVTQALTHLFGAMCCILDPLLSGGTAVLADRWEPAAVLDIVAENGVTMLAGAPPFVGQLLAEAERTGRELPALRMVLSGATTVPGQLVTGVPRVWGVPLRTAWAMTEVPGHTWTRHDDPPLWGSHSDGRPGPGLETDFRTETGEPPTPEQPGRLFVRGGGLCLGTFGRDGGELRVIAEHDDGWYDTGDLAVPDGRGGLRIFGRAADRIGGSFMIPVADVETELLSHPGVRDVALVGYRPREDEELACAVVVPGPQTPTLDGLRAFLTDRGMTEWYQPSRLELVTELPRNAIGKVRKDLLRAQLKSGEIENLVSGQEG
ncbi:AMP-binding protein [Kitasatospora sp. NPDC002227]|uniref:AMP-binding protein n=1 Tax=Kitasatospora sp. NPDC002227 TaxID=3154773 RepID=UPI003317625C